MNCGEFVEHSAVYCPYCGKKIEKCDIEEESEANLDRLDQALTILSEKEKINMKTCVKKIFRWIAVSGSIVLVAGITSFITTKKTVWITLKRKEESPYKLR